MKNKTKKYKGIVRTLQKSNTPEEVLIREAIRRAIDKVPINDLLKMFVVTMDNIMITYDKLAGMPYDQVYTASVEVPENLDSETNKPKLIRIKD